MNNYNMSDSGENIEFSVFYDNELARIYYDDFEAENTRLDFGRDCSLFLIGDYEKPLYKKSQFSTMKKSAIFELWLNYEFGYNVSINDYPAHEYISDLLTVTIKRHYEWLISQYNWHEIRDNFLHDYYISRGYSQGDAVYIVSIDKPIDKLMRKYVDNILWDCPITICARINNDDYECENFLSNCYRYDTDDIKARIAELDISAYAKQWLSDNLPDYPAYL